jgi:hypothetical protein
MPNEDTPLFQRVLRQPLLHFLVLGLALFGLYLLFGGGEAGKDNQIVVSAQQVELLASLWERQWRRPATPQELDGLIQSHIREEVLYREALAMGLDRDDTIIRRRLAQKIEFLAQDLAAQSEPTPQELRTFFEENSDRFRRPARITFTQVYVSVDRRGEGAVAEAGRLLEELRAGADPQQVGDSLMLQRHFVLQEPDQVARNLGTQFAADVFELPVGEWQGPVRSGYGLHLVRVEERQDSYMPPLEEVQSDVRNELLAQRRRDIDEAVYERLREGYEIVVEMPGD